MLFLFVFFFFFKQKTAYEMCGRDWSSDVCSSDLYLWSRYMYAVFNADGTLPTIERISMDGTNGTKVLVDWLYYPTGNVASDLSSGYVICQNL